MASTNFSITFVFSFMLVFLSLITTTETAVEYRYHICPNTTTFTPNSNHQANLKYLLSSLSSNSTHSTNNGFFNTTAGDSTETIFGLFLCRGDVSTEVCQECVSTAAEYVFRQCPIQQVSIIWYNECMVRYSTQSIFGIETEDPFITMCNRQNRTNEEPINEFLPGTLAVTLADVVREAANDQTVGEKFAVKQANFTEFQTLYTLAQCTPDLTVSDCSTCLATSINLFSRFCSEKIGGRALLPSCNVRYEVYPFYNLTSTASPPPALVPPPAPTTTGKAPPPTPPLRLVPSPPSSTRGRKALWIAVGTSVSVVLIVVVLGSCIFYICRSKEPNQEEEHTYSHEVQLLNLGGGNFSDDYSSENLQGDKQATSQECPLIRLDLITAATQHFSDQNKLGEGGFGPVYKGTLVDGKKIAVKRLSMTSGQGLQEFKNEVTLIAKLQHRNLVRLLGCCLEKKELLLIYEYMPNKSLDLFLFDSSRGAQLVWKQRLVIINGIARGLLYLHEDSRLRIIHRDLKTSNVLLDDEMNPKISDFGMARIFGGNQIEANTNRVVGTYGYMAPEYAMEGLFSVKSDVYSFGVLLLEIISGKKNGGFFISEYGQNLLSFAWKLWCDGRGLELMDPILEESFVAAEVLKCIQIGLLCVQDDPADRPTMSYVAVMLRSDTVTLPQPIQPLVSVGRLVAIPAQSSSSNEACSVNEVAISHESAR